MASTSMQDMIAAATAATGAQTAAAGTPAGSGAQASAPSAGGGVTITRQSGQSISGRAKSGC